MRGFGRRFAAEVGLIVLVAVGCALANFRWPAIVLLVGAAWILTAVVEYAAWRRPRREHADASLVEPEAVAAVPRVHVHEPEPETETEPVAVEPEPEPPHAWNVWELDRLAKEAPEERREELGYLLIYLRDFANPEGVLPTDFDELIRESFGDLHAAAAR